MEISKKLKINIGNYVKRLKDIDFMQPLYEAVVNSMDANASVIKIHFFKTTDVENSNKQDNAQINGFVIKDNGDGFNSKNADSFFEMMQMNKDLGKLGSGRFIWLKVFDKVKIISHFTDKDVIIDFVRNYDDIKYEETKVKNSEVFTEIIFSEVTQEYSAKKPVYNIDYICNNLQAQLLPKLLLWKQHNKNVKIEIDGKKIISNEDLPELKVLDFEVLGSNNYKTYKANFNLYYQIVKNDTGNVSTFYVAHGRQVKPFTKEAQLPKLPSGVTVTMFLTSTYFDDHIGDDRNNFDIDMNNATEAAPITISDINNKLKVETDKIIFEILPEIKKINDQSKLEAINDVPYLAQYINSDIKSIKNTKDWIKEAKEQFEKDEKQIKRDFKKILQNKNIPQSEYERILKEYTRIGEIELGRYIAYRQQIIKHLENLLKQSSTEEGMLHDVFITYLNKNDKNLKNKKQIYDKYTDANLWLLDDKFMPYKYVFSDEKISEIKKQIKKESTFYSLNNTEPDITIFYNRDSENFDVATVEIKALFMKSAEAKNKSISIDEINTNIAIIRNEIKNINNLYGFIITKLDKKTTERLEANDAMKLYSDGDIPYYYFYNKNNNAHTYIVDIESLIKDADMRNNVFLDILKQAPNKIE